MADSGSERLREKISLDVEALAHTKSVIIDSSTGVFVTPFAVSGSKQMKECSGKRQR